MTTTADFIREMRTLCERATPGPWNSELVPNSLSETLYMVHSFVEAEHDTVCGSYKGHDHPDMQFIAAARTALPELLDMVEALEKVADEASELLAACGALRHLGRLTNKDTGKRLVEVRAHKDVADFVEANYADIDFFIQKLQNALHDAGYGG